MNRQKFLKPNKKYKELRQKQKAKISDYMYQETNRFLEENQRIPVTDEECETVVHRVYTRITGLGFWIPYEEVYQQYRKKRLHYAERITQNGLPEHLLKKENNTPEKPTLQSTKKRSKKKKKRKKEIPVLDQDDRFFFIAGYTSGGAPYGVTWEEMGLEPWEELD